MAGRGRGLTLPGKLQFPLEASNNHSLRLPYLAGIAWMTQSGITEPPPSRGPEPAALPAEKSVSGGQGLGGPPPMVSL